MAEVVSRSVRDRGDEVIHAYRIFPCDPFVGSEPMSHEEIRDQFHAVGWIDGMKLGTVRNRVWEILEHGAEEIERLTVGVGAFFEARQLNPTLDTEIEDAIGGLLMRLEIPAVIPDVDRLQSHMERVVRCLLDQALEPVLSDYGSGIEHFGNSMARASFLKFVCGHDTLEVAKAAKRAGELRIRPYELFLFAHQQDFKTDKLTKRRRDLKKEFIPEPEYTSSLPIMAAHGGADEFLKEQDLRYRPTSTRRTGKSPSKKVREKKTVKKRANSKKKKQPSKKKGENR